MFPNRAGKNFTRKKGVFREAPFRETSDIIEDLFNRSHLLKAITRIHIKKSFPYNYADNLHLPFALRALITARPPGVRIRRRNPCLRFRRRLFPLESISCYFKN